MLGITFNIPEYHIHVDNLVTFFILFFNNNLIPQLRVSVIV